MRPTATARKYLFVDDGDVIDHETIDELVEYINDAEDKFLDTLNFNLRNMGLQVSIDRANSNDNEVVLEIERY